MNEMSEEKVLVKCPKCKGSGSESFYVGMGLGGTGKYPVYDTRDCYVCNGKGTVEAEPVKEEKTEIDEV